MKKLLSLLSVLTISGNAVPTTIAASPYQKEENKLENSEINYSQLKNLNRNKRNNNEINNLINQIKKTQFDGILKVIYYGPEGLSGHLRANFMFTFEDRLYFSYSIGGWYEYHQQNKKITKVKNNNHIENNISYFSSENRNNKDEVLLNNKKYYIKENRNTSDRDIFEKDIITEQETQITNDGMIWSNAIILNDKLYFLSDNNKLYEYWPFDSMMKQDEILINWKQLFNDWRNNMDFDFKNNFTSKSKTEKQSWIDNKKHELLVKIDNFKDKINIIKNRENIEQLKIQFSSLEQKIDNLRIKIDNLLNNSSNSSNLLTMCGNLTSLMSAGTSVIPVVGSIISAAFGIISAGCSIVNK